MANWNRPIHRLRGRKTENINGEHLREVSGAPRLQPSKEELRKLAEEALAEWRKREAGRAKSAPAGPAPWDE